MEKVLFGNAAESASAVEAAEYEKSLVTFGTYVTRDNVDEVIEKLKEELK